MRKIYMEDRSTLAWCTIESDPDIFTRILLNLGVKGVEVQEIYSLDHSNLCSEDVYGLVLLFDHSLSIHNNGPTKHNASSKKRKLLIESDATATTRNVYFAKQMVTNACATQALLSVLLNIPNEEVLVVSKKRKQNGQDKQGEYRKIVNNTKSETNSSYNMCKAKSEETMTAKKVKAFTVSDTTHEDGNIETMMIAWHSSEIIAQGTMQKLISCVWDPQSISDNMFTIGYVFDKVNGKSRADILFIVFFKTDYAVLNP